MIKIDRIRPGETRVIKDYYREILSDVDFMKKFPLGHFSKYHNFLKEYSNCVVTVQRVLSNGVIIIRESYMAIGEDVFKPKSLLPEDLFRI